jgi:hypothetical protein
MADSEEGWSSDVRWRRPVKGEEEKLLRVAHMFHPPPLQLDVHGGEEEVQSELLMMSP